MSTYFSKNTLFMLIKTTLKFVKQSLARLLAFHPWTTVQLCAFQKEKAMHSPCKSVGYLSCVRALHANQVTCRVVLSLRVSVCEKIIGGSCELFTEVNAK